MGLTDSEMKKDCAQACNTLLRGGGIKRLFLNTEG